MLFKGQSFATCINIAAAFLKFAANIELTGAQAFWSPFLENSSRKIQMNCEAQR